MRVSYLSSVAAHQFEPFLRSLAEQLPLSDTPQDWTTFSGVREWFDDDLAARLLSMPQEKLVAAQWDATAPDIGRVVCESFFVPTSTRGHLCSLSLRLPPGVTAEGLAVHQWWQSQPWSSQKLEGLAVPSFLQLLSQCQGRQPLPTNNLILEDKLRISRSERDYFKALADDQELELKQLREELEEARQQWSQLSRSAVPEEAGEDAEPTTVPPTDGIVDLSGLPQWVEERAEQIVVLPRALFGAKKSIYQSPALVYAGLEFLAGPYRLYRMGKSDRKQMEQALAQSTLRIAGSIGPSGAGEQGQDYFVTWGGRKRFLEFHLLKGGGRDERYCLRIYFFWSAEDQKVVVGWLPSHLDNSLT